LGNIEWAKVFGKVKNGQKKCPIFKNPKTLQKTRFPKSVLDHYDAIHQKNHSKFVSIKF
jgi:hypothetical protein